MLYVIMEKSVFFFMYSQMKIAKREQKGVAYLRKGARRLIQKPFCEGEGGLAQKPQILSQRPLRFCGKAFAQKNGGAILP